MSKKKNRTVSLQVKLSTIFTAASVLFLIADFFMMIGINNMTSQIDAVYRDNLSLNDLTTSLEKVQSSMTDYLNTKTSDSLENYFRSEQEYSELLKELNVSVTDNYYDRMERNIKFMSEDYLKATDQAIEAKRGRNVEKYSAKYDDATKLYGYINTYISSLNNAQFKSNSLNFSKLTGALKVFEIVSMIVFGISMFGSVLLVIVFTGNIVEPVKKLAKAADEVANGNFEIETLENSSNDEIGIVTKAFNKMVVSIREYIAQITANMEKEREMKERELRIEATLKDAQLKYLQAQINPHFLFNTLNAGAQLAMMEDAERTYDYIQNTAEFFRYNVSKGNTTVKLEDEITLIDNYVYILNVRFSGDIKYAKNIETDISAVTMPSMILQPIVENSVKHGISEMEGRGRIDLRVYEDAGDICVSIKDNGEGMSQTTIEKIMNGEIRESDKLSGSTGIGLDNVISRLKLFTERDDVITFLSEGEGQGCEVIIRLSADGGMKDV